MLRGMNTHAERLPEWWNSLSDEKKQEVRALGTATMPPWLYTSLSRHRLAPPKTYVVGGGEEPPMPLPSEVQQFVTDQAD